jgi:hypothetical protein
LCVLSIELSVTILAPTISKWLLDIREIFGHLYYIDYLMKNDRLQVLYVKLAVTVKVVCEHLPVKVLNQRTGCAAGI